MGNYNQQLYKCYLVFAGICTIFFPRFIIPRVSRHFWPWSRAFISLVRNCSTFRDRYSHVGRRNATTTNRNNDAISRWHGVVPWRASYIVRGIITVAEGLALAWGETSLPVERTVWNSWIERRGEASILRMPKWTYTMSRASIWKRARARARAPSPVPRRCSLLQNRCTDPQNNKGIAICCGTRCGECTLTRSFPDTRKIRGERKGDAEASDLRKSMVRKIDGVLSSRGEPGVFYRVMEST